ncbi:hypothetical protein DFH09DRAFT_1504015 [Mycena vulgaris]|nr:hypothetical protein DFH09DRAFT_1504015 [Mycena vulgaris]
MDPPTGANIVAAMPDAKNAPANEPEAGPIDRPTDSANENAPQAGTPAESSSESTDARNERFISVLQGCFADLAKRNEEQMDKLQRAVEGLRPKQPVMDKKTEFWNLYKPLADEHDKELLEKYSTDLDTCLIFAGLFSAISSAFIIQIQPELQPDPNATNQALMHLLIHIHTVNNSIFSGSDIIVPVSPAPSAPVIVAQSLLYASLACTLLAALLAVLGKQWLMYYSAAGERGTIEARGVERQRKIDGIRRWKFDTVLQTFPFLLQLSLLLFAAALSLYLWTIHHFLAIIVISLASCGVALYTFMFVSAALDRDSPFQTPLAPFLTPMVQVSTKLWLVWSAGYVRTRAHILPYFTTHTNDRAFSAKPFPHPSPEASAVAWILETSTDPGIIAKTAEQATEIQWPRDTDLSVPLTRLRENFLSCFEHGVFHRMIYLKKLREGMGARAVQYGRAYCTIRVAHASKFPEELDFHSWGGATDTTTDELDNVIQVLLGDPHLMLGENMDTNAAVKWALHVIPSLYLGGEQLASFIHQFRPERIPRLTAASFADYLFCVNCFLTERRENMGWVDKTNFQSLLMADLLQNLTSELVKNTLSTNLAGEILRLTAQLADKLDNAALYRHHSSTRERIKQVHRLCGAIPRSTGWLDVVLSAIALARVDGGLFNELQRDGVEFYPEANNAEWVHAALHRVEQLRVNPHDGDYRTSALDGLLQALWVDPRARTVIPPKGTLRAILWALATPGHIRELVPKRHTAF